MWNAKRFFVHAVLGAVVKGLGLIPDASIRRRIERSKHDLNEPISGDFLYKLFIELKRRRPRLNPRCVSRLVHNLVGDQILLGTPIARATLDR